MPQDICVGSAVPERLLLKELLLKGQRGDVDQVADDRGLGFEDTPGLSLDPD